MPPTARILMELEWARDILERSWCLPWVVGSSETIWNHRVLQVLAQAPENVFDELMDALVVHPSFAFRGLALHLARERRSGQLTAHACALLQDHCADVRALAASALGASGDEEGLEALLDTKDSELPIVKKAVVDALKVLRDTRCIPLLARWVGRVGEDDELRRKACDAFAAIADDAAMPVLSRVLEDDSVAVEVRASAAVAIAKIGGAEARDLLIHGVGSQRPDVQVKCIGLLCDAKERMAIPAIESILLGADPAEVRVEALRALVLLEKEDLLTSLGLLVNDPDATVRQEVCAVLGQLEGEKAIETARQMLSDSDPLVQVLAVRALCSLTGHDFGIGDGHATTDPRAIRQAVGRARAHFQKDVPVQPNPMM